MLSLDHRTRKGLFILHNPYNLTDPGEIDSIFETTEEIRYFTFDLEADSNLITIVEEPRYVQIFELIKTTKKGVDDFFLKMIQEYYVYDKFMSDGGKKNEFVIVNEMLYEKF